jgi:hypothetical protein
LLALFKFVTALMDFAHHLPVEEDNFAVASYPKVAVMIGFENPVLHVHRLMFVSTQKMMPPTTAAPSTAMKITAYEFTSYVGGEITAGIIHLPGSTVIFLMVATL